MNADIVEEVPGINADESLFDIPLKHRAAISRVLVIVALISAFLLSGVFSSPETYAGTIESLDQKKDTVLLLTAGSAGASAALSAIPDDTCTPLAQRLADLSGDFLVILTAIYLEKYLLTTFGFVSFALLIPAACLLVIAALFIRGRPGLRRPLVRLAEKLALLGIALVLTVPASVLVSNKIEATYEDTISQTVEAAQIATQAAEDTNEQTERDAATNPMEFFQQRLEDLQNATGSAADALTGALDWVKQLIGRFTEAVAVMVVLSCVIPILVLVFFLWVVKLILGVNVEAPMAVLKPGGLSRMARRS